MRVTDTSGDDIDGWGVVKMMVMVVMMMLMLRAKSATSALLQTLIALMSVSIIIIA